VDGQGECRCREGDEMQNLGGGSKNRQGRLPKVSLRFGRWNSRKMADRPLRAPVAQTGAYPGAEWGQVDMKTVHDPWRYSTPALQRNCKCGVPSRVRTLPLQWLGLKYGAAMPKVEGVVVCQEHAEAILDAFSRRRG